MNRLLLLIIVFISMVTPTFGWNDATHMSIVKAAELDKYAYLAVGADMAKEKASEIESPNHWCNNKPSTRVTPEMVFEQVADYNSTFKNPGHLYGAILASLSDYQKVKSEGKYALYSLGYAMHYIGDLSMPFHNTIDIGTVDHRLNELMVEGDENESYDKKMSRITREIKKKMGKPPLLPSIKDSLAFEVALAQEIARIANKSVTLGYRIVNDKRKQNLMTPEEAYSQLAESAMLIKAVIASFNK